MSEDRYHIAREPDRALPAMDGIHMTVQELGAQENRTRQFVNDDERDAIQGVAETDTQQDLARGFEHVSGCVTQSWQFLVLRDELLPSFW